VLLEIHSENQLSKINFSKNKIIGINNRDLSTFLVDMNTTTNLSNQIPDECLIVSESGINSQRDVDILENYADAFLVGEHFMKSENITIALNEFLEWCKK
jgi:indole-3-glycerol phosphate synthase